MASRWTDFLSTDGEKPTRDRDREFVDPPATRAALLADWESGWSCFFAALEALTEADLQLDRVAIAEDNPVIERSRFRGDFEQIRTQLLERKSAGAAHGFTPRLSSGARR